MRIHSIEPTPNPNAMKLNLAEGLPDGVKWSFTREEPSGAPPYIRQLLAIEGVSSVYQVADFIALERSPQADWRPILAAARSVLEGDGAPQPAQAAPAGTTGAGGEFGAARAYIQMIRGIPMQVKLMTGTEEARFALPPRFKQTALKAAEASPDFLAERKWVDKGLRYGDLSQIGEEMVQQIDAAYPEERLEKMLAQALAQKPGEAAPAEELPPEFVAERLRLDDWRERYAALDRMEPTPETLPLLIRALKDPHPAVRRLATVYLGAIGGNEVLPHLFRALKDPIAAVRRAAGDALSDLGEPAAIPAMIEALQDPSKLVRWRAARFLYEVGDRTALPALEAVQADPEFEVSLQARMAIERIEGGRESAGPAWQQMTRLMQNE
jgi:hypothetical protein